jgi:hypothetical protein
MRSELVGTALGLPIVVPRPAPRIVGKKRGNHVKVDRLDLEGVTLTPALASNSCVIYQKGIVRGGLATDL